MANGITARLFGRPRTYKPIGLDDGADLSRSTGAASTGSQVAEPRSPYAAPKMPSRGDYVPQADIEKYYSMLGSAPQRKDPGKASQVLSVLSDIFLNKDIPGTLREGGYQREQERYKSQLDPLKAKLDAGEQAYETEADRVSKQGALDLGAYNANKPTEPHYYTGLDNGGKPAEMSSRPGEEPTVLGPRYEPPQSTPTPHYETMTGPHGEPQVHAYTQGTDSVIPGTPYEKPTKDPQLPKQMMLVTNPDGSKTAIEVTPGTVVPKGAQTIPQAGQEATPSVDEQRRSDLAANLRENLDALDGIIDRRPDLFGPVRGRVTSLRQAFGSDDTDIGALDTIKHQIGMAQISAHGMRTARGIEDAATAIVNGWKNGPAALKAAIQAARNSVQTFTNDAEIKGGYTGEQKPPPAAAGAGVSGGPRKVLSQAAIQQAARDHGVSVEEATRQAKESGYTIQ